MGTVKRVAVIGAGASGLTAIKCCLDEGLEPVCFERSGYIGGLWHYTEDVVDGQVSYQNVRHNLYNSLQFRLCETIRPSPAVYAYMYL